MKQQALDECKTLKQKVEVSDQRNFELEERNVTLENDLSKSYKNLVLEQGRNIHICVTWCSCCCIIEKSEYATKQYEASQSELKLEQRQTGLLKAEINTLK